MSREMEDLVKGVMVLLRLYLRSINKASNRLQVLISKIQKRQLTDEEIKRELIRIKEILDLVGSDILL